MANKTYGYICGTTMLYELGNTDVTIYPTIKSLKDEHKCWKECGIAKIAVERIGFVANPIRRKAKKNERAK